MKVKLIIKRRSYKGKRNPNYKLNSKVHTNRCKCGKKISFYANYCLLCYRKSLKGKGNPMFGIHRFGTDSPRYIDGRKNKIKYCVDCKKELSGYQHERCGSCNKKYFLLNPKNHPNWQGGISKTGYTYLFNIQLKELIRKRDNYKCQNCNKKQNKLSRFLDVHHIDYNKENLNINNLISLCQKCNIKANTNRDYWFAYYTYIMENK